MPKALLVAEKPSVAKDIEHAYNKAKDEIPYEIDFVSAAGHVIELCEPDEYTSEWGSPWRQEVLPMIPDKWEYKVSNTKYFNEIASKYKSGNYDYIINAGDAGREGQLIQERIYEYLGVDIPILRYWADDTAEKTIIKTLKNLVPNENYKGLTEAAYLRSFLDFLIGMNFSRAITLSLDRFCSIGRVLTPTLRMLCDREKEVLNFKPTDYYEIQGTFHYITGEEYTGLLLSEIKDAPTPYAFLNKKEAETISRDASGGTAEIGEVTEKEEGKKAPMLFNLTDLQKECSVKYKYSPKRTLDIAEGLYMKKYLSYPRTESKHLTTEGAKEIPNILEKLKAVTPVTSFVEQALTDPNNVKSVLSSPKYVNNKKVSDHPALLPTYVIPDLNTLTPEEMNVYLLVVKRLVAIFLPEHVEVQTTVITDVTDTKGNHRLFKSTSTEVKDEGWKKIYADEKKSTPPEGKKLPKMAKGTPSTIMKTNVLEKQTTPPKRYTFATLLSAMETAGKMVDDEEYEKILMECAGVGTPATRADILDKMIADNYAMLEKSFIRPTGEGMQLIEALGNSIVTSPELTAKFEKLLKQVEKEEITYDNFYEIMVKFVSDGVETFKKLKRIGIYMEPLGTCPACKTREFMNTSKFYACKGYFSKNDDGSRLCSFAIPKALGGPKKTKITEKDVLALINGKQTDKKSFLWANGTRSNTSLVLDYVDVEKDGQTVKELRITFPKKSEFEEVGKCPLCQGRILKGKGYFCENWTKKAQGKDHLCDFVIAGKIGFTEVTKEQMKEILEHGETLKDVRVRFKDNNTVTGKLMIDMEKHWFTLKPFDDKPVVKCPCCPDGMIMETQWSYKCSNEIKNTGCDFSIPKKFSKAQITNAEFVKLIPFGQKIHKKNMISKSGKKWESDIWIKKDIEKGYQYTFRD